MVSTCCWWWGIPGTHSEQDWRVVTHEGNWSAGAHHTVRALRRIYDRQRPCQSFLLIAYLLWSEIILFLVQDTTKCLFWDCQGCICKYSLLWKALKWQYWLLQFPNQFLSVGSVIKKTSPNNVLWYHADLPSYKMCIQKPSIIISNIFKSSIFWYADAYRKTIFLSNQQINKPQYFSESCSRTITKVSLSKGWWVGFLKKKKKKESHEWMFTYSSISFLLKVMIVSLSSCFCFSHMLGGSQDKDTTSFHSWLTSVFMLCPTGGGEAGSKKGGSGRGQGYPNEGAWAAAERGT